MKLRRVATRIGLAAENFGGDNGFDDTGGDEDDDGDDGALEDLCTLHGVTRLVHRP